MNVSKQWWLGVALLAGGLRAQDLGPYRENRELGVKYQMPKKLNQIPLNPANAGVHDREQFKSVEDGDVVQTKFGAFHWDVTVMTFEKKGAAGAPGETPTTGDGKKPGEGEGEGKKDGEGKDGGTDKGGGKGKGGEDDDGKDPARAMAAAKEMGRAANFRQWVKEKDHSRHDRQYRDEGKTQKKSRGQVPYVYWEYLDDQWKTQKGEKIPLTSMAACYDLPDREVVILCQMPDPGLKKWKPVLMKVFDSVMALDDKKGDAAAGGAAESDDKLADTPERKESLAAARKNIAGNASWDIYLNRSYITLFEFSKPEKRQARFAYARELADKLEKVRELYIKEFPPHANFKAPWSIFRVCASYDSFRQYGNSSPGVVGWFHPVTKELVVFRGDEFMGTGGTDTVAFHEGWHQYCDTYFGFELQRWFDEGHGDYFGSFIRKGTNWGYEVSKMRKQGLNEQVRNKSFVPLKEIVYWNKDKFYGAKAVTYYEQAYGMVDFLRRGNKTPLWKKEWDNIIPVYVKTAMDTKDQKKAVDAAFAGVDWDEFEKNWVDYVRRYL